MLMMRLFVKKIVDLSKQKKPYQNVSTVHVILWFFLHDFLLGPMSNVLPK